MIRNTSGDLLEAEVEALVNTVNCVGVMGKGIALQFKRRFPDVFKQYEKACRSGDVEIGKMFVTETHELSGARYVINFPTKTHWRAPSRLEYIRAGLADLREVISTLGIQSIALPPLGAGNGGLNWADVEPLIHECLADLKDVDILVFAPSTAKRSLLPQENLSLSWGRALLLRLLQGYVHTRAVVEPWEDAEGASHLEIQKLMYFANEVEPRLGLRFEAGRYGPYSDQVRHLVQEMEGTYVSGFGDGTSRVMSLDPIAPTAKAIAALREVDALETGGPVTAEVLGIISGFEGPYGLELLASTHFVARTHGTQDVPQTVRSWTRRKRRIFTDRHVESAMEHLTSVGVV